MAIVTISREYGSRGAEIARGVAGALGYHLVERATFEALFQQYGILEFEEVYDAPPGFLGRLVPRRTEFTQMMTRIVGAVARHGDAVILGRGGYAVLRGLADVLNVRVQAPRAWRVQRVVASRQVPGDADPEEFVREIDERRAAFVQFSYGVRWDSTDDFDLAIDVAKLPAELATAFVVEATRSVAAARGLGQRATDLPADPVLENALAEVLGCRTLHRGGAAPEPPAPIVH